LKDGAHHLDMRGSNPNDPPSVIAARKQELTYLDEWVRAAEAKALQKQSIKFA
jgi:hypothetical protein